MTTLNGLFDPQPRCQRNFLMENKRDVKAKSTSNHQKHLAASNFSEKRRLPQNPLQSKSISSIGAGSRRRLEVNDSADSRLVRQSSHHSKDESSQKIHCFGQSSELRSQGLTRQPISRSMKAVSGIQKEIERAQMCPSLMSEPGVQTEDKDGIMAKDSSLQGNGRTNNECKKREVQSLTKPIKHQCATLHSNYNQNCDFENNVAKEPLDNSRSNPEDDNCKHKECMGYISERPMSYKNHSNVCSDGRQQQIKELFNVKSSHMESESENLKTSSSTKFISNTKDPENAMYYPSSYQKGVVPKYLAKRKTEQALASAHAKETDPNCPLGHVVMPDSERRETLDMILKNYNDLISDLNKIPVRTDTLKMKQRKMEIEKQLDKLEEGIRIFSRSKVYVKLDA